MNETYPGFQESLNAEFLKIIAIVSFKPFETHTFLNSALTLYMLHWAMSQEDFVKPYCIPITL